jgi:hypothetical protein
MAAPRKTAMPATRRNGIMARSRQAGEVYADAGNIFLTLGLKKAKRVDVPFYYYYYKISAVYNRVIISHPVIIGNICGVIWKDWCSVFECVAPGADRGALPRRRAGHTPREPGHRYGPLRRCCQLALELREVGSGAGEATVRCHQCRV